MTTFVQGERRAELVRAMPSAAENLKENVKKTSVENEQIFVYSQRYFRTHVIRGGREGVAKKTRHRCIVGDGLIRKTKHT